MDKMVDKEIERIVKETLEGTSEAEDILIRQGVAIITAFINHYPIGVQRRIYEIGHRYTCLMEGLKK